MKQQTQIELLDELLALQKARRPFQDAEWSQIAVARYLDEDRFAAERQAIFAKFPRIVCHGSELAGPGSFQAAEHGGLPLLVARGADNQVRAFLNVCRHRGARLVAEGAGCKRRFSCPYHGWTYSDSGELLAVPHEDTGFPGLDRASLGLSQVGCAEHGGWVWLLPADADDGHRGAAGIQAYLGGLAEEVEDLGFQDMAVWRAEDWTFAVNWKLLIEGGLEAYHFRVAHRQTIASLFLDNLSTYRGDGDHIRSVLARANLADVASVARGEWCIRNYANILYSLFPTSQLLVQSDHVVWIQSEPLAVDSTRVRLRTLVPTAENRSERQEYWDRNHALTVQTLLEDFALGEGIQDGLGSGANRHFTHGRFEGALARFNRSVDRMIAAESVLGKA